ncbi:helix-turn-helix domain-containing protein [Cruoricaptor ignavus]|uniref:Helix-turn-helix domain-containing protein n=1 Tax=Cruoricaptor ignavus TaxID=1118202 RepID=A0A7M1T433_9FLAO|nr:helix-turn-helix domain-containing protein [Cruoricaptor ignavus]QOR74636.1 helix-turn-helix domain-containing protein [Cruoricaptor ignavus]
MSENQRLKELQKLLQFDNQVEFAKKLGIKQGSLSSIYTGRNRVSNNIKYKLKTMFNVNMEWFATGFGDPFQDGSQKIEGVTNGGISQIKGNNGNITITHNDFTNLLDLQKSQQELQAEWLERLKESQNQITELINLLKNK